MDYSALDIETINSYYSLLFVYYDKRYLYSLSPVYYDYYSFATGGIYLLDYFKIYSYSPIIYVNSFKLLFFNFWFILSSLFSMYLLWSKLEFLPIYYGKNIGFVNK